MTTIKTWYAKAFTPHARGSTWRFHGLRVVVEVYPACAGIDRRIYGLKYGSLRLPRMRGDRPPL